MSSQSHATTNEVGIRLERRSPSSWRVTFDLPPLNKPGDAETRLGYYVGQLGG